MGELLFEALAIAALVPSRPAAADTQVAQRQNRARPSHLFFEYLFLYNRDVETDAWLARVRHDLVKRLVWPARDRRDVGGAPVPGELVARLIDDEGAPITAPALWATFRAEGPGGLAVKAFEAALAAALAAAVAGDVEGVLALELAFDRLARALKETP
jgi:hypothetical protein